MRIAAFTMVYNESDSLTPWISHYGRELGRENLYCIDHGSDDGSTGSLGISVTRFPRRRDFDTAERSFIIANFHASLLRNHDAVIFTDVDEFLVVDPARSAGLRQFIAASKAPVLRAMGLDVFHERKVEAALDQLRPVLQQRRRVKFAKHYCKTLVAGVPVRWGPGFHACSVHAQPQLHLLLFHLKYADRDIFARAVDSRRAVSRSATDIEKGYGYQWRMPQGAYLNLVYSDHTLWPPGGDAALEPFDPYLAHWQQQMMEGAPIPDEWRTPPSVIPGRFANTIPGLA
ncbi:MAG: glycosyltransferase family 2 protein [Pseudomonadota bacterium]